ncbi:probable proline--tRNA ligase, mitochondrial [Stomoxys calcitrans]|uniref:Probable proline--tRNA ligase, mitochondrial n=1 Tax=Stomoxys calcitrans TaxID=35570 RepID=A0A1I8P2Z3_STOCA|nr:probable proline--tRNA ligase, mitochondrial [Stomoxys calcitrans]
MQKLSRLYWPVLVTPKNAVTKPVEALSKSQKLMTELGLLKPASNGTFQIMPIGQRSLDKLCHLVNEAMFRVEGQKMSLPILTSTTLWKKSGRLQGDITEFFMLRDRHDKSFLLSPTHEEAITSMLAATAPISHKQLPLRLYQIGPKFRDELKARFGLMRAKEFLMKDMYSFDRNDLEARETYELVNESYLRLFKQLEVPFEKVEACTGMMGGKLSHEYHYISPAGEDNLLHCQDCNYAFNEEVSQVKTKVTCVKCQSSNVRQVKGMEVAHTFLLGDRYSKVFNATYLDTDGKPKTLIMGCYGIGISRILAASLEVLSNEQELKWPTILAPYDACVIGPKQGSKEAAQGEKIEQQMLHELDILCGKDVLHDDRKYLTIGKRLMEAKRMGYPLIIVIGSKSCEEVPKIEIHINGKPMDLDLNSSLLEIREYLQQKTNLIQL